MGRGLLAVAIALLVLLAGYGAYALWSTRTPGTVLTVFTYPSFLGGGCGANGSSVLAPFEAAEHVTLRFECPAGTLASTLIADKGSESADVVVGLDEVTGPQAEAAGVLTPYTPPNLANVPANLSSELGPTGDITPYEWGYLGIDACAGFPAAGATQNLSFPAFVANSTLARNLIVEDPTSDITGEEFLLWEIAFYDAVLHAPWQAWWTATAAHLTTADSWDTAFAEFTCTGGAPKLVVSYLTDPAYAAASGEAGSITSSVSLWNGTEYGWKTVYGAAIVKGSPHPALDEAFLNYLLSGPVQSAFPTSEWEYPANATVPLPSVYANATDPASIVALNGALPPATIAANLSTWIEEWQTTVDGAG